MGIVSVNEVFNREASRDEVSNFDYSRTYEVITDDQNESEWSVINAVGIGHRSSHPNNAYSLCTGLTPRQVAPYLWEVTATWSTQSNQPADPLNYDEVKQCGCSYAEYPVFQDRNGDLILNSAGLPLVDPSPVWQFPKPDISRSINLPWNSYSESYFLQRCGKINSSQWGFAPARTMRCSVRATQARTTQNGVEVFYWQTQWDFHFLSEEWKLHLVDAGYYERKSGDLYLIRDEHDEPISTPHCLKSNGEKLPDGQPGHFLEFDMAQEENFNSYPVSPPS